ncbi:MAG: tRNA (N(6)-L-threonylcarbamoyladenosine(37)-C(2))-methylthiotransferase MtaB [Chlamydia sp. 32-24]|nr:MAG: tRNA (N(6)-L-threonylcarbamoyladenosine(37)-C(2))-methylthiotransferase MtaB [Chlamydia sp. 32-24]
MSAKKFKIVTLGCRTNQYESQAYQDQLLALGYEKAQDDEEANVCIVNTCTVTESADSTSRHEVRKLLRENPNSQIVATGCSADNHPQIFKELGAHHVVANKNKEQLLQVVFPEEDLPEFKINHFEAHTRAFVKVQDGCNSFCSYCIIPYVRGRSRSRGVEEIVTEVKALIQNGYQEVVLTGINIGDFDGNCAENPVRLAELVKIVDEIPGLKRLRISSIDPDEVDDDLLNAVINGKNTCHSMHIVLQSGSNVVLKKMNRKYTRQMYLETIDRLRRESPDFTFTTDVIVGFPGETDGDFEETLEVLKHVKPAAVHMFPYSVRKRTKAALMPNKISPEVIKARKAQVLKLSSHLQFALCQEFVGRTMDVLTESVDNKDLTIIHGHTSNFLPVLLNSQGLKPNQIVTVKLIEATPLGLKGEVIS